MVVAISETDLFLETEDNFQKQTSRTRTNIYSPNGLQTLIVPVKHANQMFQKTKDVKIENDFDWQKQHLKSLEAAYRSSPFFEYFEAELQPIFSKKQTFLLDLNIETLELSLQFLRHNKTFEKTTEYLKKPTNTADYRALADGKKDKSRFCTYKQVFDNKHGFINNLSILDLIFNEGKFAMDYLNGQYSTMF